jgi:predicted DNA-binding mobile mystery protein A
MNAEIQTIILKGLDRQLPAMQQAHLGLEVPSKGWLRAVRGALGLTQRKVAAKLRMKQQPYAAIEEREMSGTVTLETLRRAAGALDCELVYFLVPRPGVARSFEELAMKHNPAQANLRATEHSMALEGQAVHKLLPSKPDQPAS